MTISQLIMVMAKASLFRPGDSNEGLITQLPTSQ